MWETGASLCMAHLVIYRRGECRPTQTKAYVSPRGSIEESSLRRIRACDHSGAVPPRAPRGADMRCVPRPPKG
eukprot:COSAG01_NODE_287_length_19408_cov_231.791703_1_plen_73_part_00